MKLKGIIQENSITDTFEKGILYIIIDNEYHTKHLAKYSGMYKPKGNPNGNKYHKFLSYTEKNRVINLYPRFLPDYTITKAPNQN
jgi:hypothetical protein